MLLLPWELFTMIAIFSLIIMDNLVGIFMCGKLTLMIMYDLNSNL